VHGFDLDEDVIALARANAETEGLAGRVTFSVAAALRTGSSS
jgi:23S rRNA G2445 N2-methylase RlmL